MKGIIQKDLELETVAPEGQEGAATVVMKKGDEIPMKKVEGGDPESGVLVNVSEETEIEGAKVRVPGDAVKGKKGDEKDKADDLDAEEVAEKAQGTLSNLYDNIKARMPEKPFGYKKDTVMVFGIGALSGAMLYRIFS